MPLLAAASSMEAYYCSAGSAGGAAAAAFGYAPAGLRVVVNDTTPVIFDAPPSSGSRLVTVDESTHTVGCGRGSAISPPAVGYHNPHLPHHQSPPADPHPNGAAGVPRGPRGTSGPMIHHGGPFVGYAGPDPSISVGLSIPVGYQPIYPLGHPQPHHQAQHPTGSAPVHPQPQLGQRGVAQPSPRQAAALASSSAAAAAPTDAYGCAAPSAASAAEPLADAYFDGRLAEHLEDSLADVGLTAGSRFAPLGCDVKLELFQNDNMDRLGGWLLFADLLSDVMRCLIHFAKHDELFASLDQRLKIFLLRRSSFAMALVAAAGGYDADGHTLTVRNVMFPAAQLLAQCGDESDGEFARQCVNCLHALASFRLSAAESALLVLIALMDQDLCPAAEDPASTTELFAHEEDLRAHVAQLRYRLNASLRARHGTRIGGESLYQLERDEADRRPSAGSACAARLADAMDRVRQAARGHAAALTTFVGATDGATPAREANGASVAGRFPTLYYELFISRS